MTCSITPSAGNSSPPSTAGSKNSSARAVTPPPTPPPAFFGSSKRRPPPEVWNHRQPHRPRMSPPTGAQPLMSLEKKQPDNDQDQPQQEHKDRDPVDPVHVLHPLRMRRIGVAFLDVEVLFYLPPNSHNWWIILQR